MIPWRATVAAVTRHEHVVPDVVRTIAGVRWAYFRGCACGWLPW